MWCCKVLKIKNQWRVRRDECERFLQQGQDQGHGHQLGQDQGGGACKAGQGDHAGPDHEQVCDKAGREGLGHDSTGQTEAQPTVEEQNEGTQSKGMVAVGETGEEVETEQDEMVMVPRATLQMMRDRVDENEYRHWLLGVRLKRCSQLYEGW